MKAGYKIGYTNISSVNITEIQVGNYHNINRVELYFLRFKSIKDDNYENIIGRWNIKYK